MLVLNRTWNKRDDHDRQKPNVWKAPMTALRVLVVEDDALMGDLLAEMLEEMGHSVCSVALTEADAVKAAARDTPDLMMVDVALGRGSGIVAMDQILRTGFVLHFFMTGNVAKVRAQRPDAAVLEKPFQEKQLKCAIDQALETADAQRIAYSREAH
jgi:two-component system, response regulator PdtaR